MRRHLRSIKQMPVRDVELAAHVTRVLHAGEHRLYQARPENIELMTFLPEGGTRRVSRCWQMPRSYDELVERRKALQAWALASYGFTSRSRTASSPLPD